jgi:hypothetical protein
MAQGVLYALRTPPLELERGRGGWRVTDVGS